MFARGLEAREQEFLDSLHVMEVGMRHFFAKAMHAKTNKGKPETIDANMLQAVSIAEKIAPYKHARLSAVKLAGDPNNPARFKDDATADELRAELMKRLQILTSAGLIDLQALPAPDGGNSESADARRRSIGDERGVTRTGQGMEHIKVFPRGLPPIYDGVELKSVVQADQLNTILNIVLNEIQVTSIRIFPYGIPVYDIAELVVALGPSPMASAAGMSEAAE